CADEMSYVSRVFPLRWWSVAVLAVCAVVSTVLVLTTVEPFIPRAGILAGGDDFDTYRDAARHVREHLPLYADRLIHDHLYTYTPFSAVTFFPFDLLPHGWTDVYTWMIVNLVVLVLIVVQCWRMLGYRTSVKSVAVSTLIAFSCTFLEPVRTTLFYGQINLVLLLVVLWDAGRGEHSRLRGVGVGIAAGIKLTPAYFVFYYLTLRQWRSAAVAVATFAATVAVGWLVLPTDSGQYWSGMLFDTERIGEDLLHPSNQSLRGTIARLAGGPPANVIGVMPGEPPPTWVWLLAAVGVVVVAAVVAVRLYRCGEHLLALTVTGLTAVVVSPFSWTHHWVWFVPLVVYLLHRALTNHWWWLPAVALFLTLGAWPYQFPVDKEPRVGLYMFPATWVRWDVVANLYLLLFAAVMIGAAAIAFYKTREQRRDDALGAEPTPAN
ncbi:MAG: hypothetical protein QOH57_2639, partial [Mycobacterium sp.]|nr:hypothetical protein [Mycobacterium sp.]